MAAALNRPCAAPGCPQLVPRGYCEAHQHRGGEKAKALARGTSTERGYDWKWRRFREWFLQQPENVMCADCSVKPSQEVHHKMKIKDRPDLRLSAANCMGLCKPCHTIRTERGE